MHSKPSSNFLLWLALLGVLFPILVSADIASDLKQVDKLIRLRMYEDAVNQLQPLVKQNNSHAQLRMASLFRVGKGVEADVEKAMLLYEKASQGGLAEAQYTYAIMLEKRIETDQDQIYFFRWLLAAAEQGHRRAISKLAQLDEAATTGVSDIISPDYIFEAIRHNDVNRINSLLQRQENFDLIDSAGRTPIMVALLAGHEEMVNLLLPVAMQLNRPDNDQNSAIHIATNKNFKNVVVELIDRKVDLNATNGLGNTALMIATRHNNVELVRLFLSENSDHRIRNQKNQSALDIAQIQNDEKVNQTYRQFGITVLAQKQGVDKMDLETFKANLVGSKTIYDGWPLISIASLVGESEIVQGLIAQGENINATDPAGNTALHRAASEGRVDIIKLLLDNGSKINAVNRKNETALYFAAASGRLKAINYLMKSGASTSILTKTKSSALMIAISNGHESSALKLINAERDKTVIHLALLLAIQKKLEKLSVNLIQKDNLLGQPDADIRTAIWHSANLGLKTVSTELLKKKNIQINLRDSSGYSALARAVLNGHEGIATQLISKGADVKNITNEKNTLLMLAVTSGKIKIVGLLISNKVDLNAQDKSGDTALIKAARVGDSAIVDMLLDAGANPQLRNLDEVNAFDAAMNAGEEDTAELIKQKSGALFKLFN